MNEEQNLIKRLADDLDAWLEYDGKPSSLPKEQENSFRLLKEAYDYLSQEDKKMKAYEIRAKERFERMDILEKKINFDDFGWDLTDAGIKWKRLMNEQCEDEYSMGL